MVREHSLSTDDTAVAIFHSEAEREIGRLDATDSNDALTAIINCLSHPVPESVIEKGYENCKELQQLRQGDLRLYVTLVTDIPDYTVLWVFAVKKHRYRNLQKFDARACGKVRALREISPDEIEGYLQRNEALTLEKLRQTREQL